MADFDMRNFNHFPMEKSSYDLKLELLEEVDPKEAMELMKANRGFRSIYLRDPWRIFGPDVDSIRFSYDKFEVEVRKLSGCAAFPCNFRFHLLFLRKLKSCVKFDYGRRNQQSIEAARKILSNLDSIGEWWYSIGDLEVFQDCFSNFKGQITDRIRINLEWCSGEEDNTNLAFVTKVFETQLGRCKSVIVNCCVDRFAIICKLFTKTRVERIQCQFDFKGRFSTTGVEKAIRWLFCNGIPSQNREASISLLVRTCTATYDLLDNFLSAFPGMQQIAQENKKSRRYLRKIDGKGDCIFEWKRVSNFSVFRAKYVPSQAE